MGGGQRSVRVTVAMRSPGSTWVPVWMDRAVMIPALVLVMGASIFMASMTAIRCPGWISSPMAAWRWMTPGTVAARWAGLPGSALARVTAGVGALVSMTRKAMGWPLASKWTLRRPV